MFHGSEHVLGLYFSDVTKLPHIRVRHVVDCHLSFLTTGVSHLTFFLSMQVLILKICRLYNVFGCGSSHGIYAIFIAHTTKANGGRAIGLLRGAGTRFATWFYAMHRAQRLERALLATDHDPHFAKLDIVKTKKS